MSTQGLLPHTLFCVALRYYVPLGNPNPNPNRSGGGPRGNNRSLRDGSLFLCRRRGSAKASSKVCSFVLSTDENMSHSVIGRI